MQLFLIRGLVAIAWAFVLAVASDSLDSDVTTGVAILLVIYPLIDVIASLIDARGQRGSARGLLGLNAAISALAAVAFAVAGTGTVANALAVFGVWAAVSGVAQVVVAIRRRAQLGSQWPLLLAGALSTIGGPSGPPRPPATMRRSPRWSSTRPPAGPGSSSSPGCSTGAKPQRCPSDPRHGEPR
jgi:uncharacterized membrane protein HdeD (DUF308 family)